MRLFVFMVYIAAGIKRGIHLCAESRTPLEPFSDTNPDQLSVCFIFGNKTIQ